ncbi:MAG: sialidase family protein [Prosthecobacter sp.]
MRLPLLPLALLASTITSLAEHPPVCLTASQLSIATGQPSLVLMSSGSTHIPVWSLSGGTVGQSVTGLVSGLPSGCAAVKIEIVVTSTDETTSPQFEDVYRVHLSQMVEGAAFTARNHKGTPVRTALPAGPLQTRTITLESYYEVVPGAPLAVRIQREPGDPGDTFIRPTGLAMVKVTPVDVPAKAHVVQEGGGYNSWPMLQAIGDKLVCVYTRGKGHNISEGGRDAYARTSSDGGKTWTPETVVTSSPDYGEVPVGKGLDANGAMLLWLRRVGKEWHQDLYRTTDGITFTLVATPKLAVRPMQITDIFSVPKVGLMALWFAGDYGDKPTNAWGTVTSSDNGASWTQTTIESGLPKNQWPTEPAAVHLGEGRILAIARTETGPAQFQITSTDSGATWKRVPTLISDVFCSTPNLVLDAKTGLVSCYYYHRGKGLLRRRVVDPNSVFDHPGQWPASEVVAVGSKSTFDAGNVNATFIGGTHYLSFYSGKAPETAVLVSALPAPDGGTTPTRPAGADQPKE